MLAPGCALFPCNKHHDEVCDNKNEDSTCRNDEEWLASKTLDDETGEDSQIHQDSFRVHRHRFGLHKALCLDGVHGLTLVNRFGKGLVDELAHLMSGHGLRAAACDVRRPVACIKNLEDGIFDGFSVGF